MIYFSHWYKEYVDVLLVTQNDENNEMLSASDEKAVRQTLLSTLTPNTKKEEFFYNSNGKNNVSTSYVWKNNNWRGNEKFEYEYNANGRIILQTNHIWDTIGAKWQGNYKYEVDYDANGRQILYASYYWNVETSKWQGSYKNEYEYDGTGRYRMNASYNWNVEEWKWQGTNKYEYQYNYYYSPSELRVPNNYNYGLMMVEIKNYSWKQTEFKFDNITTFNWTTEVGIDEWRMENGEL